MEYYIGIDLGGTNIAAGLVDKNLNIVEKISTLTHPERGSDAIIESIVDLCYKLCQKSNIVFNVIKKIGIGIPGTISSKTGMVMYSCNLPIEKTKITDIISEKCENKTVKILNDADAAAYGEYIVSKEKPSSFICITLGTGIGAGIILDGKIYNGFNGAGAEIGHITLIKDGIECSCGRRGCWEKYASASALISQVKEAIKNNPSSIMAKDENINGKTVFDAAGKGDETAKHIISKYIEYVSEGLVNVVNIFQPSKIVIGGGISHQGEEFIKRIREYVYKYDYNRYLEKTVIATATLFNDAGIIGAALY